MLIEFNYNNIFILLIILITKLIFIISYNKEFPFWTETQVSEILKACNNTHYNFCKVFFNIFF